MNFIKNFNFYLPNLQTSKYNQDHISFNSATLNPRSIYNNSLYEKKYGMYVNIIPRNLISKL